MIKILRIFLLGLISILLLACASKALKLPFYDSKHREYWFNDVPKSIGRYYKIKTSPTVIIVQFLPQSSNSAKEQIEVLESLDAEAMNFIYVVSDTRIEHTGGYYLQLNDAKILQLKYPESLALIVNPNGHVLRTSKNVLTKDEILKILDLHRN